MGSGGQIAQHVVDFLRGNESIALSLFARRTGDLSDLNAVRIAGDVLDRDRLNEAIAGQDVVYANLAGAVDRMAENIVESMMASGVKRLIFVTSLGIYDEVPGAFGKWNNSMIGSAIKTYRKAADVIEASDLDYTIVRPAWLTDDDEVDFETTQKSEPFKGTEVSRKSVAAYIANVIEHPGKDSKASVGVNKPNTDGDRPAFY